MSIHPTAIISKEAQIADDAIIGPFCVINGNVKIGKGTQLLSHVTVGSGFGEIIIGENNQFSPGSAVGGAPQDLKYAEENTRLVIGNGNKIRECVTLNLGTEQGGGETKIGNDNLLMAYVHIAHDCHLQNNIVIANSTQLAGHVEIEDRAIIGGVCCVNQFVRLGKLSYTAGDSSINKDILPFTMAQGRYAVMRATNKVGLERAGYSKGEIENIHKAIRFLLKGKMTQEEALQKITDECEPSESLEHFVNFIKSSTRGLGK